MSPQSGSLRRHGARKRGDLQAAPIGRQAQYNQKNYSAWSPPLWPVKLAMTAGILLMLLQVISQFFKDLAEAMGRSIA